MVYVAADTFQMGSTEGFDREKSVHSVTLTRSFYINKYEVTHEQFIKFLNARGVSANGSYNGYELIDMDDINNAIAYSGGTFVFGGSSRASTVDTPVIEVTWYGAVEYCNWLSESEGLTVAYSGNGDNITCDFDANGYRLPTEAEREFAGRGGNQSAGYTYSRSDAVEDVAWYFGNSQTTHDVGTKTPNELGISMT